MSIHPNAQSGPPVNGKGLPVQTKARADFEAHDPDARERAGQTRFLCPFPGCVDHQNPKAHRSLCYNEQTGLWHCHRCDTAGQDPAFWKQQAKASAGFRSQRERGRDTMRRAFAVPAPKSLDVPAAPVRGTQEAQAAQSAAPLWVSCLGSHRLLLGTPGAAYLEGRALPADFCAAAGVRFSPDYYSDKAKGHKGQAAVVFPLMDADGRAVAAQGRLLSPNARLKALTTRGGTNSGLFDTIGALSGPLLVIVEAPLDALSLALCGLPAVATCGASNFPDRLKHAALKRVVLLAHDSDTAGDKASEKITAALALAGPLAVLRLRPEGVKDWNDFLQEHGRDALTAFLADFVSANAAHLLPLAFPCPVPLLDGRQDAPRPELQATTEPAQPAPASLADVPSAKPADAAALLAFVRAEYRGTGADIRQVGGRVVWVEGGCVTGVWNGPKSGRLVFARNYWRPVQPFPAP